MQFFNPVFRGKVIAGTVRSATRPVCAEAIQIVSSVHIVLNYSKMINNVTY